LEKLKCMTVPAPLTSGYLAESNKDAFRGDTQALLDEPAEQLTKLLKGSLPKSKTFPTDMCGGLFGAGKRHGLLRL